MCISKSELEKKVQEIRRYKAMAEEAAEIQKALEAEVINYMVENGLDTEITDSAKTTYKSQTRATLDKKRLEEDLGSLEEYTKVTEYKRHLHIRMFLQEKSEISQRTAFSWIYTPVDAMIERMERLNVLLARLRCFVTILICTGRTQK